ncbi:MAG: hypothetical protein M1834_000908 [Cirrosporium novae-zelandiae]|nr:MAG: hypothetical protein M1834_000908 [Cirrosporium novae-zelandiae]
MAPKNKRGRSNGSISISPPDPNKERRDSNIPKTPKFVRESPPSSPIMDTPPADGIDDLSEPSSPSPPTPPPPSEPEPRPRTPATSSASRIPTSPTSPTSPIATASAALIQARQKFSEVWPKKWPAHPFVPTPIESPLIAIPPLVLLTGLVFSLVHPAPSYFSKKSNIFNVLFVKLLWFWTTIAFFIFLLMSPLFRSHGGIFSPRRLSALARYGIFTCSWFLTTQWFFGAPLIDRSFTFTGGSCALPKAKLTAALAKNQSETIAPATSASACRSRGGHWEGGHDISGHVFLLVIASTFLAMEMLPVFTRLLLTFPTSKKSREMKAKTSDDEEDESSSDEEDEEERRAKRMYLLKGTGAASMVVFGSWWMLLMTAIYFHTWFEKITGFILSSTILFAVYFAPRLPQVPPQVRAIIGSPGQ